MKLVTHADPVVLEGELLRRVAAAQSADPLAAVLVVVPTARLARHVVARIARSRGAAVAIEVLHHRRLILKALAETAGPFLLPLPETLHAALLRRVLEDQPEHPWSRFARERPGAVQAVGATLTDLREAGISSKRLGAALGAQGEELRALYGPYEAALARAARQGFADEAGLVEAVLPRIAAWAGHFKAAFHHGAYELTGVHLELVQALDRVVPVDFLLPAHEGAPAFETAAAFRRAHLSSGAGLLDAEDASRAGAARLAALYREDVRVEPMDAQSLDLRHVQGARAELTLALRGALAAVAAGAAPSEVAIVARSLDAYAADAEPIFSAASIPWTSSATAPLRRDPAVHDLLVLLRTVADDFPRRPTCELLTSSRLRWDRLLPEGPPPELDLADAFTLEASITQGFEEWTEDLPEWAEHAAAACEGAPDDSRARFARKRAAICRGIAGALRAVRAQIDPTVRAGWAQHAERVEAIARRCVRGFDGAQPRPAVARVLALLDEMRSLEAVVEPGVRVPFAAMVAWLEGAVDETTIPVTGDATDGIQVLDAMQARGLTFRHLFLVGMNAGSFPRAASEDPLLGDRIRRRLREATGCPIPVKAESDAEERLLLALLLGSARETVAVSWQRADEAGRARPVSLALREIARLRFGEPDLDKLIREAARVPAHPAESLAALAATPGLLAPDEAELLAALQSSGATAARRSLAALRPDLDARLALVEAVEAFAPGRLDYDGMVGALAAQSESLSVGALERLGGCALQYFFRHVLRIDEVRADPGLFDFDTLETGSQVHDTLRRVYAALSEDGLLHPGRYDEAAARLPELVPRAWLESAGSAGVRLARRAPVLASAHASMWTTSLLHFVAEDLRRLSARGVDRVELEVERRANLAIGEGIALAVHGRFDRVAHGTGGPVVSDFKTSKRFADGFGPTAMLQGTKLQLPLYSWMEDRAAVELLQVRAAPDRLEDPVSTGVKDFKGFSDAEAEGFAETLRVLANLRQSGLFPLRHSDSCSRCPYEDACRHEHPPTTARLARLGDGSAGDPASDSERVRRYQLLPLKKRNKPLLATIDPSDAEDDT